MDHVVSIARSDNAHTLTLAPSTDPVIQIKRSKNYHTLTLATPIAINKEVGDYDGLINKPSINGVILQGNLTWQDLGLPEPGDCSMEPLTTQELDEITDGKE